jgi:hypothetical protein
MKLSEKYPAAHAKYVVRRDSVLFTATPCYGLHAPWWVVRVLGDNYEADPEPMQESDEWWPLDDFMKDRSAQADGAGELVEATEKVYQLRDVMRADRPSALIVALAMIDLQRAAEKVRQASASKPTDPV